MAFLRTPSASALLYVWHKSFHSHWIYGNRSRMGWGGWICHADVHRMVFRRLGQVCTIYNTWKKWWVSNHIYLNGSCSAGVGSMRFEICFVWSWAFNYIFEQLNGIVNGVRPSSLELHVIDFMIKLIVWCHHKNEYSPEDWCEKLQTGQNITVFYPLKICNWQNNL